MVPNKLVTCRTQSLPVPCMCGLPWCVLLGGRWGSLGSGLLSTGVTSHSFLAQTSLHIAWT